MTEPTAKTAENKYLQLLSEKYPTTRALSREIINLTAILNLPKGTEHFMSDLHGEYEAFLHILNNCSGVVREKVDLLFGETLSAEERKEICTLIYYPKEKLQLLRHEQTLGTDWYETTLQRMIELARMLSSKYTRSKVRKAMPEDYAYIIDELLHVQKDEDDNQILYHSKILETIISIDAEGFLIALAQLIKRLAVDHLHILGDIFDRGPSAEKIMELLMRHHSLDITWGNHDILWMGAAAGSEACIANVVRNSIKYNTLRTLENGYGISLRNLTLFAEQTYPLLSPMEAALKAISVIQFKLEGQIILRRPEYEMHDRLLLGQIRNGEIQIGDQSFALTDSDFPTCNEADPYALTPQEADVVADLNASFRGSTRLREHITFLYEKGGMYRVFNGNLLYHGCIPMNEAGEFDTVTLFGKEHKGKNYLDFADSKARHAFFSTHADQQDLDFMWYLWTGKKSPLCGRIIKTFERAFVADRTTWNEPQNPYYEFYRTEQSCRMILKAFGLRDDTAHIINGHTPVHASSGELPVRAGGRLLVIDGGFCKDYHATTGIAGYTLIFNSHGLRLKSHQPFESVQQALTRNKDIHSRSQIVETQSCRLMVMHTDAGKKLQDRIADLQKLLELYRSKKL